MQPDEIYLAAAERLIRLRRPFSNSDWTLEQFAQAASEGKRRWEESEELFDTQWSMFQDAVSVISPKFLMERRFVEIAEQTDIPCRRNVDNRIALWFMRWARCPLTAEYPNPYEPWIEIWENGGSFSVEHGQFLDTFGTSDVRAGWLMVRRA